MMRYNNITKKKEETTTTRVGDIQTADQPTRKKINSQINGEKQPAFSHFACFLLWKHHVREMAEEQKKKKPN